MGIFEKVGNIFNKSKREGITETSMTMQNKKIEEQMEMIQLQQEKIDAIVAKVKNVASQVKETRKEIDVINEKRNKCVNTYTKYDPSQINEMNNNLKVRRLSKESEFNYIVTLVCDNNKKDEIVMGQFNNGDIKIVTEKFEEMLKFQENLQYGDVEKDVINEYYKKLAEYAKLNNITITKEGEEILTNTNKEARNISKTCLFIGDDNTIEKAVIKNNQDILNDYDNYTFEELPGMREVDKIVEKVVDINKQENIEELLINNKEVLSKYLESDPEAFKIIKELHRSSIENDICLDAMKYLEKDKKDFEKTDEYNYMRLITEGKTKEAKNYYNTVNLNISKLATKLNKKDTSEDIQKKMRINRFLHEKHKQNVGLLNAEQEKAYEAFLDSIKPDPNYEIINSTRQKEKMYLAGIIDKEKTKLVNENKGNIKELNERYRRQDFDERINYEISDNYDGER